jgi:hypothetical protein
LNDGGTFMPVVTVVIIHDAPLMQTPPPIISFEVERQDCALNW